MKRMTSRVFGIWLALCVAFTLVPINAFAAGADSIVQIARAEVGTSGRPNKYTYWTGRVGGTYSYAWCASFVSWCASQAGESGAIPKTVNVREMANGILRAGGSRVSSPQAGDIVVYRRVRDDYYAHVGIMENSSTAIEGNSGNAVRQGIWPGSYSYSGSSVSNGKIEVIYLRPNYRDSGAAGLTVQSYFDCDVKISTTRDQRVNLYTNPTNSSPKTYFIQGQPAYSTRGAKLSDGSTWYEIQAEEKQTGNVITLWLNAASGGVTVADFTPSAPAPAKRTPVDLGSDFYAYIVNTGLKRYVTNDANGNVVSRSQYNASSSDAQRQIWHFKRLSSGAYKIASSLNNYCLDVQEFGESSGTNARAYPDNGCSAQQWYLYEENGAYNLRGACTDCYLDVSDNSDTEGQNIHLWEPNGTGAQRFSIEKVNMTHDTSPAKKTPANLGSDFYAYIVNTGLGRYVTNDADGNVSSRGQYSTSSMNIWRQIWHFKRLRNGAYKIVSPYNDYCLDVQEFGKSSGTNARTYLDNGCSAQQWYLYEENGAYNLRGACTDCYLDVSDNSDTEGQNIQLYEPNGTGARRFSIEKVNTDGVNAVSPAERKPVNLGSDFYAYIVNTGLGKYVTNDANGNVVSRSQHSASSDAQRQIWHFKRLSNGAYKIASSFNNYCLDVQEFGKTNGTNARAYPDNGCSAQQWYLYEENGAYTLRGACTDCYLDVSDNSGAEGQNIHLWEPNGTGAQRFSIQKTDMTRVSSNISVGSSLNEPITSGITREPPLPRSGMQSLIGSLSNAKKDIEVSTSAILKHLFKS